MLHNAATEGKHATPVEKALRITCRQQRLPAAMHLAGPQEPCSSPCNRLDPFPDPEIDYSSQSVTGHSFGESSLVTPVGNPSLILFAKSPEVLSILPQWTAACRFRASFMNNQLSCTKASEHAEIDCSCQLPATTMGTKPQQCYWWYMQLSRAWQATEPCKHHRYGPS